jgi:dTDP-4-amino-4,6-dideoxygalactose transaminase
LIGSAFRNARWLSVAPTLPLDVYRRARLTQLPFPLEEANCRLFRRARHGLHRALQHLSLQPGDEILAPAYHHGSEIETLIRAGLRCRFYDCDERLAPDPSHLNRVVTSRTRALYLIHYLGFPQEAARWRHWSDERGLLLLEDAAQSWLALADGKPVGSAGELAIYCLHKSVGLPDGGALVAKRPPPGPAGEAGFGLRRVLIRHRDWLAQRYTLAAPARRAERFAYELPEAPSRAFQLGNADSPPSRATLFLLPRLADPAAAQKRQTNYLRLLDAADGKVPEAFRAPPLGSAPYVFPISATNKRRVLEMLASHGVVGGKLWETPHPSLDTAAFPVATRMRETLVGLPVHQELRPGDVDRIAEVLTTIG